ncbi:MAG: flagellar protein [Selenomonadaceae bacterium]|nr:flagellar protein [Selenomonadaceae bacterium]
MATLMNCAVCGKLFSGDKYHKVCPACMEKTKEKEDEVVQYVRDNPKSKVPDIVEATGASEAMIKRLISEGRFIQVGVKMTYPCEKCGEPIIEGKLCQQCQEKIRQELQATSAKIVASRQAIAAGDKGHGMYSKDMRKK